MIRPNRFIASQGVSAKLTSELKSFYSRHQQRQKAQAASIRAYDEREQKRIAEEERAKPEAALRMIEEEERRHERAKEERKQSEEDARKRAMESALKRRCHDEFARDCHPQALEIRLAGDCHRSIDRPRLLFRGECHQ